MIGFSFLNPFLLWGAGLASVPLIIHILNRRRFRILDWAAMEFLLRAFKENRRRVRFEQLLLLLLRMAIPALLAFLLARPKASSDDFLGLARKVVHHCIVLDDSGSMTASSGAGTAFDEGRRRVLQLVTGLSRTRSGDLLTVLLASRAKPLLHARPVTLDLGAEMNEILREPRATPDRFRPAEVLERVRKLDEIVGERAQRLSLYFVSDFRKVDFEGRNGGLDEGIVKGLRALRGGETRFFLLPVLRGADRNLAVTRIQLLGARVLKNVEARFEVTVANLGRRATEGCELGFRLDGGTRLVRRIPAVPPGGEVGVVFRVGFETEGDHFVEASLPADRLPIDDRRALAFPVAPHARVLLVDGDPGEREELSETFYLSSALDPTEDGTSSAAVTRMDDNEFGDRPLEGFDLVVLANVASVSDEQLADLEAYVRGGGGLFFFTGDQVDPETWNRLFWKEGRGLLPAALAEIGGDLDHPVPPVLVDSEHPLVSEIGDLMEGLLRLVRIGRWNRIAADPKGAPRLGDEARVVLRLRDESGPPLLIEGRFGKGRVGLMTTTADASWTNWPADFSYPVLCSRLVDTLMRKEDLSPRNLGPRGVRRFDLAAAEYSSEVRLLPAVERDDGFGERLVHAVPRADEPDLLDLSVSPEDGRSWPGAGPLKLELARTDGAKELRFFTVSPWPEEGRVEILRRGEILSRLPRDLAENSRWIEGTGEAQAGIFAEEGEIWRVLAFALLLFLLSESLLAWRFGHH